MNEKDFEIPEGWSQVQRPPIEGGGAPVPPVPVDRFASGAISTMTLGLNTDIADSQMGGSVPVYRVQPPQPSGIAAIVATVQSTQILVPPPATSGGGITIPDVEIINSNVQSGTSYLVQLSDRDTLISVTNNAGGTVTLPGGTSGFSVVRSAVGGGAGNAANASINNDFNNTMVAAVYSSPNGGFIPNIVTDTLGNLWTMINDHATAGGQQVSLWIAYNIKPGANVVNALQPLGVQFCMVIVHEFLGVLPGGLDQVAFGTGSATILPTVPNTFAYCSARTNSLSTTQFTPGTPAPWINLLWNAIQWTNPPGGPPTEYLNGVDEFIASVPVATLIGNATGAGALSADFVMANFRTTSFSPGVFPYGWYTFIQNTGTGTFIIQSTAKIDGSIQTVTLPPNTGILVVSDGTQYWTDRGIGSNVLFETNGTPNSVQNVLDLNAGTNITLVEGGGVVTISASGGGGITPNAPIVLGPFGYSSTNPNWANESLWSVMRGPTIMGYPSTWEVKIAFVGGTGAHIAKATIMRTLVNSNTVIDVTNILFSGSTSATITFGSTPTINAPAIFVSDAISLVLDADHDYWILYYFDNDGGGLNAGVSFPQSPASAGALFGGHNPGDQSVSAGGSVSGLTTSAVQLLFWSIVAG